MVDLKRIFLELVSIALFAISLNYAMKKEYLAATFWVLAAVYIVKAWQIGSNTK